MDSRLLQAARSDDVNVLSLLAEEDVLGVTPLGNTALHIAIRCGSKGFASSIYNSSPNVLWKANVMGETPLHCAASCGHLSMAEWVAKFVIGNLMQKEGAEKEDVKRLLRMTNQAGETALHVALQNCNEIMALSLLEADPDLSQCVNNAGESALYLAANFGFLELVSRILQSSSAPSHGGLIGRSPLHAGICAGNIEIVEKILKVRPEEIKQVDENRSTPMHYAVSLNQAKIVKLLLERDTSTAYAVDSQGTSPVHLAAALGYAEVLQVIIDHCLDSLDVVDANGKNALHVAVENGRVGVTELILSKMELGGLINQRDADGNTPSHLASINFDSDILYKLIKDGRLNRRTENHKGYRTLDILLKDDNSSMLLKQVESSVLLCSTLYVDNAESRKPQKKKLLDLSKKLAQSMFNERVKKLSVVGALLVTVTFTAAFSVPGGYLNDGGPDDGLAILTRRSAFKAFLICDTLALCFSLILVTLATTPAESAGRDIPWFLNTANGLLGWSLTAVALSFAMAIYVVVAPLSESLAIFVCVTCAGVIFCTNLAYFRWTWRLASGIRFTLASKIRSTFCYKSTSPLVASKIKSSKLQV